MAPAKKKQIFTEALILDIQTHRALWDKTCKDHKDIALCGNAWKDIQANLEASHSKDVLRDVNLDTLKGIKSHWKNLKDTYRTKKYEAKGKSGVGRKQVEDPKKWPFFEMLRFLDQADAFGPGTSSTSSHIALDHDDQSEAEDDGDEDEDIADQQTKRFRPDRSPSVSFSDPDNEPTTESGTVTSY